MTKVSRKSFKTTLDLDVQSSPLNYLDKAASVCVMNIYNGDIVSLVSSPIFDPNAFVHGVEKKYWESLIKNKKNLLLTKLYLTYPPGSTIKTLVALAL